MGYILELRKVLGSRPLIMAGTGVIIVNEKNQVLLGRRTDNGFWDYPGGSMELGESFEECARREVLEETGLTCGKLEFLMDVSGEDSFYQYPNGDKVYIAGIVYLCRDFSGELKAQEKEVAEQRFFPIDQLPENIAPGLLKEKAFRLARERLAGKTKVF